MSSPERLEGIAIVGMACRFPDADTPHAFWGNLVQSRESITFFSDQELARAGVPKEVLAQPNYVKASSLLKDIDQFDAPFFGYSAKEADWMDPQHRLFLEVAWEAFEDAGYNPEGVRQLTGVFAGTGGSVTSYLAAYPDLVGPTGSLQHIGNDKDFLSTRVSFKLDLKGPSINVQTACSTSLVVLHLACRSILDGECDMALAGVATVRVPHISGYFYERGDILSPDGHCRTFDEKAQGTIFGSGAGAVVLKRLEDAVEAGDQVYAVIRGTAIGNDGGQKVSYTASSVAGQSRAIVEALGMAGFSPDTIGYVEAHGTATSLGDPLEIQALSRAFATGTKRKGFCAIGSVKSNIGHLEQAAGMASLIKAAMMLKERKIPASLHYEKPNPKIDFGNSPFFVNTQLREWESEGPRRLGINGLGLGGTNAFAVLEEAPELPRPVPAVERPLHTLSLSARTQPALVAQAERFLAHLSTASETPLADVCFTANVSRTQFSFRLSVTAGSQSEMCQRLARAVVDGTGPGVSMGQVRARPVVFLFTGQGAQYSGMARELYQTQPMFRDTLDRCEALTRPLLDRSLLEVIFTEGKESLLEETRFTQPALFSIEYALATLWSSWGVKPTMVMGHSVGEIAAACFAGAIGLEEAIQLITHRGRLMNSLPRGGGMAAVFTTAGEVEEIIAPFGDRLAIAAINAPKNTVVSGDRQALEQVLEQLRGRQIEAKTLPVSHAFHSPLMDPILDEFEALARGFAFRKPRLALLSNLTGKPLDLAPTAEYWRAHARGAVRFLQGMEAVQGLDEPVFLEIGPGSSLLGLGRQCLPEIKASWLGSLSRKKSDWDVMMESLRTLYTSGQKIDWAGFDQAYPRRRVSLPTYVFQRKRHWVSSSRGESASRQGSAVADGPSLLGKRLRSAVKAIQFESFYSLERLPFLDHHRVRGLPVLPITAGLEAITAGAREHFGAQEVVLEDVSYPEVLSLPEEGARIVQLILSPGDSERVPFQLLSTDTEQDESWRLHMTGTLRRAGSQPAHTTAGFSVDQVKGRCARQIPAASYYPALQQMGLEYGALFQGVQELWQGDGEALGHVRLPGQLSKDGYQVHPAVLDACLHVYHALTAAYGDFTVLPEELQRTFLPISIERFQIFQPSATEAWVHAVRRPERTPEGMPESMITAGLGTPVFDLHVYSTSGELMVTLEGVAVKELTLDAVRPSTTGSLWDHMYQVRWDEAPRLPVHAVSTSRSRSHWLILSDRRGVGAALSERLTQLGDHCDLVFQDQPPTGLRPATRPAISAKEPALFHRLLRGYFAQPEVEYRGVIYLWALDAQPAMETLTLDQLRASEEKVSGSLLLLMQSLAVVRSVRSVATQLWVVSGHAQAASEGAVVNPLQAPLWALGRSFALRHPQLWGGLVDLDASSSKHSPSADAEALVSELLHAGEEDQVVLRGGKRYTPRLVRKDQRGPKDEGPLFRSDSSYLITGGLGARGLAMARWLVEHRGVRYLALADAGGVQGATAQVLRELEAQGARISLHQVEINRDEQVQSLIDDVGKRMPPLRGVLHLVSSRDDDLLDLMGWASFSQVTASRAHGAWLLHKHTSHLELDHFLVFSSPLALTGSVAQANLGAADAFLEGLAAYRRSRGLPAVVMSWGPWECEDSDVPEVMAGFQRFNMSEVGTLLRTALQGQAPHVLLAAVDWSDFLKTQFKAEAPALFSELVKSTSSPTRKHKAQRVDPQMLRERIQSAAEHERRAVIIEVVLSKVMESLGMDEPVDTRTPLREFGLDSLITVDLVKRLEPALGVPVPFSKIAADPSIEGLVDELFANLPRPTSTSTLHLAR